MQCSKLGWLATQSPSPTHHTGEKKEKNHTGKEKEKSYRCLTKNRKRKSNENLMNNNDLIKINTNNLTNIKLGLIYK